MDDDRTCVTAAPVLHSRALWRYGDVSEVATTHQRDATQYWYRYLTRSLMTHSILIDVDTLLIAVHVFESYLFTPLPF